MANAISWTKKVSYVSLSDETALKQFEAIGLNKGLAFCFKEGEEITFPDLENACIIPKTWKDKANKTQRSLNCLAHSSIRGGFELPLAALRRVPIAEDRDSLYDEDNTLGEMIAQSNLSDIERYKVLLNKRVSVSVVKLRQPKFEFDSEKGWTIVEGETLPITCFKFREL